MSGIPVGVPPPRQTPVGQPLDPDDPGLPPEVDDLDHWGEPARTTERDDDDDFGYDELVLSKSKPHRSNPRSPRGPSPEDENAQPKFKTNKEFKDEDLKSLAKLMVEKDRRDKRAGNPGFWDRHAKTRAVGQLAGKATRGFLGTKLGKAALIVAVALGGAPVAIAFGIGAAGFLSVKAVQGVRHVKKTFDIQVQKNELETKAKDIPDGNELSIDSKQHGIEREADTIEKSVAEGRRTGRTRNADSLYTSVDAETANRPMGERLSSGMDAVMQTMAQTAQDAVAASRESAQHVATMAQNMTDVHMQMAQLRGELAATQHMLHQVMTNPQGVAASVHAQYQAQYMAAQQQAPQPHAAEPTPRPARRSPETARTSGRSGPSRATSRALSVHGNGRSNGRDADPQLVGGPSRTKPPTLDGSGANEIPVVRTTTTEISDPSKPGKGVTVTTTTTTTAAKKPDLPGIPESEFAASALLAGVRREASKAGATTEVKALAEEIKKTAALHKNRNSQQTMTDTLNDVAKQHGVVFAEVAGQAAAGEKNGAVNNRGSVNWAIETIRHEQTATGAAFKGEVRSAINDATIVAAAERSKPAIVQEAAGASLA